MSKAFSGFPPCQLFEVYGSKFEPHPVRDPGQTTVVSIPHIPHPLLPILSSLHQKSLPLGRLFRQPGVSQQNCDTHFLVFICDNCDAGGTGLYESCTVEADGQICKCRRGLDCYRQRCYSGHAQPGADSVFYE